MDLLVIVADVDALAGPLEPVLLRLGERKLRVDGIRQALVRREPRQDERDPLAGEDREFGDGGHLLPVNLDGGPEAERVRPGNRDPGMVDAPHPRHDRPVVEADHELRAHPNLAVEPLDDPNDVRCLPPRRHEVDRPHPPLIGLVDRLQDQRVVPVPARRPRRPDGGEKPAPVLRLTEQRRKTGARVEAGEATPVDRARPAHECGRLEVPDQRVVLDSPRVRHARRPLSSVRPVPGGSYP